MNIAHQVLAALERVEDEVSRARGEVVWVAVPGAVELKRNLRVNADAEVVVEHLEGQLRDGALGAAAAGGGGDGDVGRRRGRGAGGII